MTSRVFEKTPPNSSGIAGFIWRRHGGHHSLNGRGELAKMVEDYLFFKIFIMGRAGLTRPIPNSIFASKRGEQPEQEQQHVNSSGTMKT